MKCNALVLSCIFCLGCHFDKKGNGNKERIILFMSDSTSTIDSAIVFFNQCASEANDSVLKYNLSSLNDSCIKYIYGVNGRDVLDTGSAIFVARCAIKMIRFSLIDKSFKLEYALFVHDSIPKVSTWANQPLIHSFECDMLTKKIKKAYLGQHFSFTYKKDLDKWYENSLGESRMSGFLRIVNLHPDFIRLVGRN